MTKEEQQERATLSDHIVIHKVTDNILAMHKDGTEVYAVEVIRMPLVRCRDCKHWQSDGGAMMECANNGLPTEENDFCSWAKRREP